MDDNVEAMNLTPEDQKKYDEILRLYEEGSLLPPDDAIEKYEEALEYLPECLSDTNFAVVLYAIVADNYMDLKDIPMAERYYFKAYNCFDGGGNTNPYVLFGLGVCYYEEGDMEQARNFLFRTYLIDDMTQFNDADIKYLECIADLVAESALKIANAMLREGSELMGAGKYQEALKQYEDAHAMEASLFGEESNEAAAICSCIGEAHLALNEYDEAEKWFRKDLEIALRLLGDQHVSLIFTYENMARLYAAKGNYSEAVQYYLKALDIYTSNMGDDHPDVCLIWQQIALLYDKMGNLEAAAVWSEKQLEACRQFFGENGLEMAEAYRVTAMIQSHLGNSSDALGSYKNALKLYLAHDAEDQRSHDILQGICTKMLELTLKTGLSEEEAKNELSQQVSNVLSKEDAEKLLRLLP